MFYIPSHFFFWREVIIRGDFKCIIDKGDTISTFIPTAQLDTSFQALEEIIEDVI